MNDWNSQRAKKLISDKGLRTDFVADQCGVSTESLRRNLRGLAPSKSVLILLSQVLNTTTDYLTGKSDDPKQKESA